MDYIVEANGVHFSYKSDDGAGNIQERKAVNDASFKIGKGEYVAVLGPNGSGKSTIAKLIDILELPDNGKMCVFGKNTNEDENFWEIRENTSYVFQNPDNQIVGTIVEEDVAFGPENIGVPLPELRERVDEALEAVGLKDLAKRQAATLSGGQKQKLAIAGALAMKPSILILDEATAMLDPQSRDEFLSLAEEMRAKHGLTLITITHDMSEAKRCDRILVVQKGQIVREGKPNEIFSDIALVDNSGLELPTDMKLSMEIGKICGKSFEAADLIDEDSLIRRTIEIIKESENHISYNELPAEGKESDETILKIENLSFQYEKKTTTLDDISFDVRKGEILAIVGKSGCGKTTLISHFNAIFRPQIGDVRLEIKDKTLSAKNKKDILELRQNIGLVFQYPEYQLFEETVYKDISYGLRKMGLDEDEQRERIFEACELVGFDTNLLNENPFELSGGQKRRVALAGVLVMRPKILVLDEPASGLDPVGRIEMFRIIKNLKKNGTTIILVSHNMDEAAAHADRICCIKEGKLAEISKPEVFFDSEAKVNSYGLSFPNLYYYSNKLKKKLNEQYADVTFEACRQNVEEEAQSIINRIVKRGNKNA